MRSSRFTVISELTCKICGQVMYVPRPKEHKRKIGHIKHLFCPKCKKVTEHVENYGDR